MVWNFETPPGLDLDKRLGETFLSSACLVHMQGRTMPNVGSLLQCEADILQLDVMNVRLLAVNKF